VQTNREDVVRADEDVDFSNMKLTVLELNRLQHGEQRVSVLFDLRPLVAVARVFDGQLVQAELFAHFLELGRLRILEADPDEAVGAFDILADGFLRNVAELGALLIRDAVH